LTGGQRFPRASSQSTAKVLYSAAL
jgi:hypothetical protein